MHKFVFFFFSLKKIFKNHEKETFLNINNKKTFFFWIVVNFFSKKKNEIYKKKSVNFSMGTDSFLPSKKITLNETWGRRLKEKKKISTSPNL